ncbi:MAG: D-aminoacylase [Candidatus Omnitrophica bacterium]|nr:D-aminoacylase [Candidatus Omnitrophota bacterium]
MELLLKFRFLRRFVLFDVFLFLFIPAGLAEEKAYDFLIENVLVFDGKSAQGFEADVAISHEYIADVGNLSPVNAREVIDGEGWVLAPGFIDAHTHSDFNPFIYPRLANKLSQGVTTEIIGNCGMSAAPILGGHSERIREIWAREGVLLPDKITWTTFKGYGEEVQLKGVRTNFIGLVGHGNLRSAVMGLSSRAASADEIQQMKTMLTEAMGQGAFGISFGLRYLPGLYAKENELIELCSEAARHEGVCAFHIRSERSAILESLREVIAIAEKSNAPVQVCHLKIAGEKNWPKIDDALGIIEEARRRGVRILADAYPYDSGYAELGISLPPPLYKREDRVEFFKNPSNRKKILRAIRNYAKHDKTNWDTIMIASTRHPDYAAYQGQSIAAIARQTHLTPEVFLMKILADTSFEVSAFYFSQKQDIVDRIIARPYVAIGSDSIADGGSQPHPRFYGTFPKMFRYYIRESEILGLAETIQKMTSLVAEYYGVERRGRIQTGYYADLVLFDPETVTDLATYKNPTIPSRGIQWVFVNGRPAVREGRLTDEKNGRLVLKHEYPYWFSSACPLPMGLLY